MENQKEQGVTVQKTAISLLQRDDVKQKFKELLGNKSAGFLSSVLSAVQSNEMLKKATPESVYMSAMMAAALDLPINQNLGFAYIIPYNNRVKGENGNDIWVTSAQFQMGYKGFIQLAQRTGLYKTISACPVYEGQLISEDPLKGFVFDWTAKTSDTVIGYAGFFALMNGFEKTIYMTVSELQKHGARYSKTYSQNSSKWKTDFEAMAMKTVIKLLIAKYGPLSVDVVMQKAVTVDQSIINDADTMDVTYVDSTDQKELPEAVNPEYDRLMKMIKGAKNRKTLTELHTEIKAFSGDEKKALDEAYLVRDEQLEEQKA